MATKGQFLVLSDLRFLPPIVETRKAAAGEEADQLNCFEHSPQNPSHAAISTFSPDFTEFPPELFEISQFLVPSLFSQA